MAKSEAQKMTFNPDRGPVLSLRFVIALVLIALGIAWTVYYYVNNATLPGEVVNESGPAFVRDLRDWNYLIGFGLLMLGLMVAAHPSTPLGRGRGVVAGMLGCFLVGLLWICTFYAVANEPDGGPIWLLDDLGQKNLIVGIAFMAVGFTYATRWE